MKNNYFFDEKDRGGKNFIAENKRDKDFIGGMKIPIHCSDKFCVVLKQFKFAIFLHIAGVNMWKYGFETHNMQCQVYLIFQVKKKVYFFLE